MTIGHKFQFATLPWCRMGFGVWTGSGCRASRDWQRRRLSLPELPL